MDFGNKPTLRTVILAPLRSVLVMSVMLRLVTPIPILILRANLPLMMIDMWTVSTFYARHQLLFLIIIWKRGVGGPYRGIIYNLRFFTP